MYVTVTDAAYKRIMDTIPSEANYIKLFYDNEGCGCVMSGIIDLVAVSEKDDRDVDIESNKLQFIADRTKLVFMDDKLIVDLHESGGHFQLKSPSQFYNPNMKLHIRV
ncbi:heme biosynthesis protein HemY [Bacillus pseudomycoides]|uniref:Heme biosynthesis protein HemY n=1 Tax=Bacillus pseudomycoides TaxID=64104 RepID=A0AA91V9I1_9BACI|nr:MULTISPECIES: iron-sulfur cluster biosynthesis family protein [Bacillus]PEB50244.1 heme biosynthesis protein HemY [Bacillus sp. AFS098217]PED81088.1 heme biosynthesis protein HemY [Bacillus pseudomycoides]PEU07536.1 heme biosynthesis protein HemY [Bacillus sp. AFS019443]PEU18234.1 heme biosynthesis protein HemY [Bacillus sp. AFS014408]PFW59425.1 heme biosynthesis protein HemY [Bacillus sp. AFS075034]